MKKILVVLMVMLLPLSAMAAMTSISDSELAEVSGQVGVSIAIVDFTMDMSIANFTYDDTDTGTVSVSNRDVAYGAGFVNIGPIKIDNLYVTLAGNPVWASGTKVFAENILLAGLSSEATNASIGSGYNGIAGQMLEIDVMTAESGPSNPYYALRADTATDYNDAHSARSGVLIGIPDMYISLEGIDIDGIYFDSVGGDATSMFYPYAEKYKFSQVYEKDSTKSLGSFHINGIAIHTYSSVPKTTTLVSASSMVTDEEQLIYRHTFELTEQGGTAVRCYPGNRAWMLIAPH